MQQQLWQRENASCPPTDGTDSRYIRRSHRRTRFHIEPHGAATWTRDAGHSTAAYMVAIRRACAGLRWSGAIYVVNARARRPAALKVAVPKRPSRMVSVPDFVSLVARVGSDGNVLADQSPEYRAHLLNRIRDFMKSDPLGIHRPRVDDPEVAWVGERSLRPADEGLVDDSRSVK